MPTMFMSVKRYNNNNNKFPTSKMQAIIFKLLLACISQTAFSNHFGSIQTNGNATYSPIDPILSEFYFKSRKLNL